MTFEAEKLQEKAARPEFVMDKVPQRLKPPSLIA
jgi:hypothetical protein